MHYSPVLATALAHLAAVAAEQQTAFDNSKFAKGILYAVRHIRGDLSDTAAILLSQEEAVEYTGYSERHIRRTFTNRGSERRPEYRLGDLLIKPGHTPQLPRAFHRGAWWRMEPTSVDESPAEGPQPQPADPAAALHETGARSSATTCSFSRRTRHKSSPEKRAMELARRSRTAQPAA